jgi:hypothetical protein
VDDDALLHEEQHWRSMPGHRRRPAGTNAITAIGIVIVILLWGITAIVFRPFLDRPSGNGIPRALVTIVVCGIEALLATAIAGRLWVAIGPGARRALRPFGVLGPWPMLAIGFFATVSLASMVAGPFLRSSRPVTSGRNWHFVTTDRLGATYEEALELCRRTGDRVPTREDLALFDPPFPRGTSVWLERPEGTMPLSLTADGRFARLASRPSYAPRDHVVCFRP